jgi:hypothetical protein
MAQNVVGLAETTVAHRENVTGSIVEELRAAVNNLVLHASVSMPGCLLSAPSVKTGTTSAKAWRSEAFTFAARGKKESKAAAETALTATTHDVAASKEAWYVLSIAAGGALTITKAADQTIGTKVLPTVPDNEVPVGYLQVITGAGGIFDATTDDLSVGGNRVAVNFHDAPVLNLVLAGQ